MMILDAMEKTANVRVLQAELNDQPGVCLKLVGPLADIQAAAEAAGDMARRLDVTIVADIIPGPDPESRAAYESAADYNPLVEQMVVHIPPAQTASEGANMKEQAGFAVGFIETQGFTAVFEAIDTAVKTAAVEVLAREKLGGGYITVIIKGDVAAVRAAIDAGSAKVNGLGRLIAAHVIPSPSHGVLSLLPEVKK
jgi:carbon dioxide concentrating mechanism protein CcmO